jgi:O-antigen/teichoic acid export membrane protein
MAAASLLATPLLLRWLGPERLGAYRALTDWIGSLTFCELGLGGALMAAFATRMGQGDRAAVLRMLTAGLRAYGWVTLAQLAGGMLLVGALPHVIALEHLRPGELRAAGALALLPVVFTPLVVFRALVEACQHGYLNWLLLTVQGLVMTGLALVAAQRGWGLIGQSLAGAVAHILILLALAWGGARAYRGVWRAVPARADRQALWALSWPTFVHGVADRLGFISDNIVIAWMLGPTAVVPFFLTQQLVALVQGQLRGLGQATWAGLAELYARGEEGRVRTRLVELTGVVSGLSLAALAPIGAYNQFFVPLWVGRDAYAGEAVTGLACVNVWFWAIYTLWGWVLLGTGHIKPWVPFALLATLVNVVVSVLGTAVLGVVGPLVGTTAGLVLITSWALPRVLQHTFKIPPWTLWRAALPPLRWGLPLGVTLRVVAGYHHPSGWPALCAAVGLGTAAGMALWWRVSLGRAERGAWGARLRSVFVMR